jgi:protein-S-isoprenylcysteine O-methyltransferase Ste14
MGGEGWVVARGMRAVSPVAKSSPVWTVSAGEWLFRNRSYLPLALLGAPLAAPSGAPNVTEWLIAAVLIAGGAAIRFVGVAAAGPATRRRSRFVPELIVTGPFAWTRNPIYTGNFLLWLGLAVVSGDGRFAAIALIFFAITYSLIVRYEEAVLAATFGAAYAAYRGTTPRWIPQWPAPARAHGRYDWGLAWRREWNTGMNIAVAAAMLIVKSRAG